MLWLYLTPILFTHTTASTIVSTLAGTGTRGYTNGAGTIASFNDPHSITIDTTNTVYITDTANACVRKITANGTVSTVLDTVSGRRRRYRWGSTREADWLHMMSGVGVDTNGDLILSDWGNSQLHRVTASGRTSVIAGVKGSGYVNGHVSVAQLDYPYGLVVDSAGNVFVADQGNNVIRKVSRRGVVSTFAGTGVAGYADGSVHTAMLNQPNDIAMDANGVMYVVDTGNRCIRKITPDGVVSTIAGSPEQGFVDGPAAVSRFMHPCGIAVDASGNVFVTDSMNHRVRKITPDGIVSTVAGTGRRGFADGLGRSSMFSSPCGIVVDSTGRLIVLDQGNHRVRRITFTPGDDDDEVVNDVAEPASHTTIPPRPIRYNRDECAICYEVKAADDVYDHCSLGCGHTFHKRCIQQCMEHAMRQECPLCRSDWVLNKQSDSVPAASTENEEGMT